MATFLESVVAQGGTKKYVMGILNLTPDSFFDGGRYNNTVKAVERALQLQEQGADIIDVGAQSTAPGSVRITAQEEKSRLLPALCEILREVRVPVSVDTYFPQVAFAALEKGAAAVNDVSGELNPELIRAIAGSGADWFVMHTGSTGGADAANGEADYPRGVCADVREFFEKALEAAALCSLPAARVCLDPGIGFGKSREDDLRLLAAPQSIKIRGSALLYGASRKRVTRLYGAKDGGLYGSLALHTAAMLSGCDIVRVHDVEQTVTCARFAQELLTRR